MNQPVSTPPRYTDRPFPPYRFVPGKSPHPTRDPSGHSYNQYPEPLPPFNVGQWQTCGEYLYGIDLFNHGYWWEAHEALEAVWVAAGRNTKTGLFIQGLIQVAVAHLKRLQGFNDTAQRMATDGLDKMNRIQGIYMGIDVAAFRNAVESFCSIDNPESVTIELIIK